MPKPTITQNNSETAQRQPGNAIIREEVPLLNPQESQMFFAKLFDSPQEAVDHFAHFLKRETRINGKWEKMKWKVRVPILQGEEVVYEIQDRPMPDMVNEKGLMGLCEFCAVLTSGHAETAILSEKEIQDKECEIRDDISMTLRANIHNWAIDPHDLNIIASTLKYLALWSLSKTTGGRYLGKMTAQMTYAEVQNQQEKKGGFRQALRRLVGG
jgi:hypothetical protein